MFRHRPSRLPDTITTPQRSSRLRPRPGRRRCGLGVARLEDRMLLSGPSGDVLAAVAPKIELGTPKTGTLSANEVVYFQITPTIDGRLIAQLHAPGGTTRLSLLDDQGDTLLTSEGQSTALLDGLIDIHVPAGTDYLECQNLGDAVPFTLTATLTPASASFQPIPVGLEPQSVVAGDFNGDGRADLAVANEGSIDSSGNSIPGTGGVSVLLGAGDGTFQDQVAYAAGSDPQALVTGDFNGDGRADLAVANWGSFDSSGNSIPGTGGVSVLLGAATARSRTRSPMPPVPVRLGS